MTKTWELGGNAAEIGILVRLRGYEYPRYMNAQTAEGGLSYMIFYAANFHHRN